MSDKAERVAKLIWDGVYGNGHVPPIVAAILREEYPEAANCYECKAGPCAGCPPLEMELCHRPAPDVSEAEKALCMDILGERGRNVDEVNRLVTLLIAYREGLKAQTAPDVSALRAAAEIGRDYVAADLADYDEKYRRHPATETNRETIAQDLARIDSALLRSEPKLGGTV
jgi:hypothetical protein